MIAPLLLSRPCPPAMAPRNALAAFRAAETAGWHADLTIAIGWPEGSTEAVRCVQVRASKVGEILVGRWEGPSDGSRALGWANGWSYPGVQRLGYSDFVHRIKGTEPVLTARAQADSEADRQTLRAAMENWLDAGASVDRVLPAGTASSWCKGHVQHGWPLGRQKCVNPTKSGDSLCPGPCVTA